MDIRMPEMDGLEATSRIGVTSEAIVVDFRASLGPRHSEEWDVPEQLLDHLRSHHGGVRGYLRETGLTPDEIGPLSRLLRKRAGLTR